MKDDEEYEEYEDDKEKEYSLLMIWRDLIKN